MSAAPVVQNDGADFVLVEAEAADEILNPDKDNDVVAGKQKDQPEDPAQVWKTVDDDKASGGKALVSPIGGRRKAGDPMETVAVYKIQFKTPGTYYLYFRARNNGKPGHGGSDSLFMPSKFGADAHATNRGIKSTGDYVWHAGGRFLVMPADAKAPLEYRVDSRETGAHLDALLWAREKGLEKTPERLDEMAGIGK